jgi:ribosome-binding factor A
MGMPKERSKMPSQRQLKVGEEIRHTLATILLRQEVRDIELEDISITVSEVRISPDLKNATAYVMPLGGVDAENIMMALQRLAPVFRKYLSKHIALKYIPKIMFALDYSFDEATRINELLQSPRVKQDIEKTDSE